MESNFISQAKVYLTHRSIWLGIALGIITTLIILLIRPFTLYRYANDPLQLVQPIIQLRFGLINFNWRLPLIHLTFIVWIGFAAPFGLRLKSPKHFTVDNAVLVARVAALVSIAYVWWIRVDATAVLIWYALSTWVSFIGVSWLAKMVAKTLGAGKLRFKT